jgi:hypothetical protein
MKKEKIKQTSYPVVIPSFNDWCRELKVSSQWVNKRVFEMYNHPDKENASIKKFLNKTK